MDTSCETAGKVSSISEPLILPVATLSALHSSLECPRRSSSAFYSHPVWSRIRFHNNGDRRFYRLAFCMT